MEQLLLFESTKQYFTADIESYIKPIIEIYFDNDDVVTYEKHGSRYIGSDGKVIPTKDIGSFLDELLYIGIFRVEKLTAHRVK